MLYNNIMETIMNEGKLLTERTMASSKKAYSKPILSKIRLVAEEAVLATCKTGGGGIGARNTCRAAGDLSCRNTARS